MKKYLLILFGFTLIFIQNAYSKDYTVHKLPSGQTLIIRELHDNPIVTIDTWVKTGSINEDDKNNGVAHFLEHMFFKGTSKYPTGKFDQILESKGAITNAATSKDFTHYYIIIPSKNFNLAMELHSDMLLNPMLPRNELETERKVVLEEIAKGNDSPNSILYKQMNKGLYKEHPYKRDVIGTEQIIETVSREEMLKFYNTWYNPDNMITVVVGDVNTSDVIKSVEEYFKKEVNTKTPKIRYKEEPQKFKTEQAVTNMNTQNGYLLIGYRGVLPSDKKESAALDVLATILGDGKSSRLYKNVQDDKQLTTYISAGHSSYRDDSLFYIKAEFSPDKQALTENAILSEIENIKKYPISKDELKKAKNIIKRETLYSRESVSNIANELGYITLLTDNPSYYDSYIKSIEKVTVKDVINVANKYLQKERASFSYILPKGMKLSEIKAQNNSENKNDKKTEYSGVSHNLGNKIYPQNNNAKLVSQNGNTKKYKLENGMILIITENKSNDIIAIEMLSKGGYFQEKELGKRGVGNLTSDMLLKGTDKFDTAELNKILDENGIEFYSNIRPDAYSTFIKITKDELPIALELFDEIINNSKFDTEDLKKVKNKRKQDIIASMDIPANVAFDEMKYLLWENTTYQNNNKFLENAYETITTDDIKKFCAELYYPENTIITVNGNVNEQDLINYFSDVFKNKKAKVFDIENYNSQIPPIVKNKTATINKNVNQTWIVLAYRTPQYNNIKDWAALKVIDSLLGTGMSSRLFTVLRDQQGLAYTVASAYQSNILQGVFAVYMGTNPANEQKAKEGLMNEIAKLKRNFVSSKELEQAKDRIIGNYLLSKETNSEKANAVAQMELYGRGYDFDLKYADYINSVTEQDIIEAANKYFSAPFVMVTVK